MTTACDHPECPLDACARAAYVGPLVDITERVRAFAEAHPELHPDNQPEPGRCTVRSFGPLVCATWDPPLAGTIRRSWSWDWLWWR